MTHLNNQLSKVNNISEGLQHSDLKDTVTHLFTIDQYQSKMGADRNTIVIKFCATSKEPAIDLMEFIEKGFSFVLDADMSAGEEKNGNYSVFVEIERTEKAPNEIKELLNSISQLTDIQHWRFRWYKDIKGHDFDPEKFSEIVPLTPEEYDTRSKTEDDEDQELRSFFNKSATESVKFDHTNNLLTIKKPYNDPITFELIEFGEYNSIKNILKGGIQLDESSQGQVLFLNKFLGNYEINKISDKFLVKNDNIALILSKKF